MGAELNNQLFSAADNIRSKMDASEYKKLLTGIDLLQKYLSDRLLIQVVELADESLDAYDTQAKQIELYEGLLEDEDVKADLIQTIIDTLGDTIEPQSLFHKLTNRVKQNVFQLNELSSHLFVYPLVMINLMAYLIMSIYNPKN